MHAFLRTANFLLLLHRECCYNYFFYSNSCTFFCCTVNVVTIISFIPTHAHFYCCTVNVVTIISFIVAPCMLLQLFLLFQLMHIFLLHRECCYNYFFYSNSCTFLLLHRECCYNYFFYSNSCTSFIHFKNTNSH